TEFIVFVDSDVELVRDDFLRLSTSVLVNEKYGAVVGMSIGDHLSYGLPAGLLALRKRDFEGKIIPDYIDARETYFVQRRLDERGLKTFYVPNAMVHRSQFRRSKPEWEGANTRILPSPAIKQLAFSLRVIILMSLNSHRLRNVAYVPIFYLKF